MRNFKLFKVISFMILTSMILAAVLVPQQIAYAKSDLVGLTFVNNSDSLASLRLYGNGEFYYFLVYPGETKYYTPVRGEYDVTFFSCGLYVNKELDLTKQTKLVVPSCGTLAYQNNKTPAGVIDGGQVIKLVKVTFENETNGYVEGNSPRPGYLCIHLQYRSRQNLHDFKRGLHL